MQHIRAFYSDFQRKRANRAKPQLFFVFVDVDDTLFETCADQDALIEFSKIYGIWEGCDREQNFWDVVFNALPSKILLNETIQKLNEYRAQDASIKVVALTNVRFGNPVKDSNKEGIKCYILEDTETCENGPTFSKTRIKALEYAGINLSKDFLQGQQYALKPVLDDIKLSESDMLCKEPVRLIANSSVSCANVGSYSDLSLFEIPDEYRSSKRYPTPYLLAEAPATKNYKRVVAFPVCEGGVVACNFSKYGMGSRETDRKGDVMWSYLETYLEQEYDREQLDRPEITVVGIDDQETYLESMKKVCARESIDFLGIHFQKR